MLERARRRADEAARPIDLRQAPAEELPFEDASFDTVVSTLVLCCVSDPRRALSEARRVLKPSGKLRLYDHVRYDHAFGAFWQDLMTPAWRWLGAGCHPNRDIAALVREAGFEFEQLELTKPVPADTAACLHQAPHQGHRRPGVAGAPTWQSCPATT